MSETGDFTPAHWGGTGHDFKSAYRAYDAHAGRSYASAKSAGKKLTDMLPKRLSTDSPSPLVMCIDETGSMGEWPKVMFSKLPYLELEGQEYLGKEMEIAWCAFGDALNNEDYPVQARPFTKGTALKERLKEIVLEGKGGGQMSESSELLALYLAHNVAMPHAVRPVCIFVTDEKPWDAVAPDVAEQFAYVKIEKRITAQKIFEELSKKFSVYVILKPYNVGAKDSDAVNRDVHQTWTTLVGADRVAFLPDPQRVVDVIFGILAKETGRITYFKDELEARQLPDKDGKSKIDTVYKSLKTVHALPGPTPNDGKGHSKTKGLGGGTKTKPLM
ncbi:MAG: hypothetical protein AAB421_04080 [Patescibacteria group bacterium]